MLVGALSLASGIVLLGWLLATTKPRRSSRQTKVTSRALLGNLHLETTDLRAAMLEQSAGERLVKPSVAALASRARRFTPAGMISSLERRPIERVLAAKLVAGGAGALVGVLMFLDKPSAALFLVALFFAGAGYFLPDALLYNQATKRQNAIQLELADALDQITITVEAGLGFEAAVDRLARAGDSVLKLEFGRMLQEIRFGLSRRQALENLVTRTQVPDLRKFVHAVAQADVYGIPIAQVLRVQSAEMRAKRRQAAEERAMKVPVKILMPVMLCILPALFIVILGPAGIRIARTFSGG
jgi:tight adherence protein C